MLTVEEPCLGRTLAVLADWAGNDLWVLVVGGDCPHIGSVSVAIPRESLSGDGAASATVSTFNVTGHLDDCVGDVFAKRLASRFRCRVSVTCGIHFDGATPEGIGEITACAERLLLRLEAEASS